MFRHGLSLERSGAILEEIIRPSWLESITLSRASCVYTYRHQSIASNADNAPTSCRTPRPPKRHKARALRRHLLFVGGVPQTANEQLTRREMLGAMAGGENWDQADHKTNGLNVPQTTSSFFKPSRGPRVAHLCCSGGRRKHK